MERSTSNVTCLFCDIKLIFSFLCNSLFSNFPKIGNTIRWTNKLSLKKKQARYNSLSLFHLKFLFILLFIPFWSWPVSIYIFNFLLRCLSGSQWSLFCCLHCLLHTLSHCHPLALYFQHLMAWPACTDNQLTICFSWLSASPASKDIMLN